MILSSCQKHKFLSPNFIDNKLQKPLHISSWLKTLLLIPMYMIYFTYCRINHLKKMSTMKEQITYSNCVRNNHNTINRLQVLYWEIKRWSNHVTWPLDKYSLIGWRYIWCHICGVSVSVVSSALAISLPKRGIDLVMQSWCFAIEPRDMLMNTDIVMKVTQQLHASMIWYWLCTWMKQWLHKHYSF